MALTLRGWLVAPPHSQPLFLVPPLFVVALCHIPPFSEAGSVFHPTPTVSGRLQFIVYAYQLYSGGGRGFQSVQRLSWIMFPEDGLGSHVWFMLLTFWVCTFMQVALKLAGGRNGVLLFSRQTPTGSGFSVAGYR
jgi:hypothetical protein